VAREREAKEYWDSLTEAQEVWALRKMGYFKMAQAVDALDRCAWMTYSREATELTPSELSQVLVELADHVERQVAGSVGVEWAEWFRRDVRGLE
jgi:hypothetical protein